MRKYTSSASWDSGSGTVARRGHAGAEAGTVARSGDAGAIRSRTAVARRRGGTAARECGSDGMWEGLVTVPLPMRGIEPVPERGGTQRRSSGLDARDGTVTRVRGAGPEALLLFLCATKLLLFG